MNDPAISDSDATDEPAPEQPVQPDPGECCGNGCAPCVFDRHDDAMQRYRTELECWQQRKAHRSSPAPAGRPR